MSKYKSAIEKIVDNKFKSIKAKIAEFDFDIDINTVTRVPLWHW